MRGRQNQNSIEMVSPARKDHSLFFFILIQIARGRGTSFVFGLATVPFNFHLPLPLFFFPQPSQNKVNKLSFSLRANKPWLGNPTRGRVLQPFPSPLFERKSMWCCKCNKDLINCVCPDIEERLKGLLGSPVGPAAAQNLNARALSKDKGIEKKKESNDFDA